MKLKITRPDGTLIEAEGTVEECERLMGAPLPIKYVFTPIQITVPVYPQPIPITPQYPMYPINPVYPWNPEPWYVPTWTVTSSADITLTAD
jgi:hypothetical protein